MESLPLDIHGELRVVTENSVCLVRRDSCCRMPRSEAPRSVRAPLYPMASGTPYVGAWLETDGFGSKVRLLPPGRPDGSSGIVTGVIATADPPLEAIRATTR